MLNNMLPRCIDNEYRGHKLALWLFGLVVALRIVQGVMLIFNGHMTIMGADGIPLDTFAPAAAQTVVSIFAISAVSRIIIALLCVLALVRYRSAIPFMFAVLILTYLSNEIVLHFLPFAHTGTPPGPGVNLGSFVLMVIGFVLSLWKRSAPGDV